MGGLVRVGCCWLCMSVRLPGDLLQGWSACAGNAWAVLAALPCWCCCWRLVPRDDLLQIKIHLVQFIVRIEDILTSRLHVGGSQLQTV